MVEFNSVTGRILLGHPASEDDRYDDDAEDLYSPVAFESEEFTVILYSGIGGYYSMKDDHIETVDGERVYFPYENEANAEINVGDLPDVEFTEKTDGVQLQYALVEGDVYVRSQNEIAAYGGQFLVHNDELYQIHNSLLARPNGPAEPDDLLDIGAVEEPVSVEHVETGYVRPIEYERVAELVENDEPNGAIKLEEPDSVIGALLL